jgi:hypothetical protein
VVSGAGERWRGGEKGGRGGYIDRRREVAGGQPVILKILPDLGAPFFFFSFFFFFFPSLLSFAQVLVWPKGLIRK